MSGRASSSCSRHHSKGFTYAGILFAILILGLALGMAGTLWSIADRRDREARLLWTGDQYQQAIKSYFVSGPAGVKQYPQSIEDLLEDQRGPVLRRHLRREYADPITGKGDWQLERLGDGSIIGLRSASTRHPIKQAGFRPEHAAFVSATCYCDWLFAYQPGSDQALEADRQAANEM
jgi:type II secretory pathway pseudopilin PulG